MRGQNNPVYAAMIECMDDSARRNAQAALVRRTIKAQMLMPNRAYKPKSPEQSS